MSDEQHDQPARVGVYVCHCGGNISDVVDVQAVADALGRDARVEVARHYPFMCSDPGQKLIVEDIAERGIDHVVVAACSPALHELTFRKALQRAGLNPYVYEHVNIREQCSWVHKGDHEGATRKAERLTAAGVEKVARQCPLEPISVKAEPHVVVIGGGVAGMRAALALAGRGLRATLVERGSALGGRVAELGTVYPGEQQAADLVDGLARDVLADERIAVHLDTEVESVEGYVGSFAVRLRGADGAGTDVQAGALVLATGFDHYRPYEGELGYGQSPQVVTLPEFNTLLAGGGTGGTFMHEGRPVRNIAFVHCVGSRQTDGVHPPQADGKVNDYCSRVCCTAALHAIHRALDLYPDLQVFDLYRDMRTYGRGHEDYYERASKRGVLFFRYDDDAAPRYESGGDGKQGSLTVTDLLTWGEEVTIPIDMVVLATGMVPRDIGRLVSMLKLPVGADRFLQEVHPKLRPVELANNGILLAGTCQGPMDIGESCAAAETAAVKAAILLSRPTIELDPFVAEVDAQRCTGCELCLAECSYEGALRMADDGGRRVASVNAALCSGCGACAAVCQPRAINVAGWTIDQFDAMVDAIVGDGVPAESAPVVAGVGGGR